MPDTLRSPQACSGALFGPGRTLVGADVLGVVPPYLGILPPGHSAQNPAISDAPLQFYPYLNFFGNALRAGRFPEWNPMLLGGVPVTPNGYVSTYYPPFWLVRWLHPFDAFNLFVVVHLVLGALGVYAFARALRVRPSAAFVAGLLSLSAAFWVNWSTHLVHLVGMVWLPWALALTHLVVQRPCPGRIAGLGIVVGLWWLGANPQYAYLGSLSIAGYGGIALLERWYRDRLPSGTVGRTAGAWAAGMGMGLALAAPVLLPTTATANDILREHETVEAVTRSHAPPRELMRLFVADARGNPTVGVPTHGNDDFRLESAFLGITSVLLVAAGIGSRRPQRLAPAVGVAAVLLLAFTPWPHLVLYELVPGYDRFRESARWLAVLPAFALPLAGLGLEALLDGDRRARRGLIVMVVASGLIVAAWLASTTLPPAVPRSYFARRIAFAAVVAATLAGAARWSRRSPRALAVVAAACAIAEVAFHTPRWYPSITEATAYPDVAVARLARAHGGRFARIGERSALPIFPPNLPMVYGSTDAQGLAPLFPKDYDRYLRLIDDYGNFAALTNAAPPLLPDANCLAAARHPRRPNRPHRSRRCAPRSIHAAVRRRRRRLLPPDDGASGGRRQCSPRPRGRDVGEGR